MKTPRLLLQTLFALAAFMVTQSLCHAAATPTPFVPHHTTISAISADSITIAMFSGSKTYKIDKFTAITFKGESKTVADLKVGMKVSVVEASDQTVAAEINASDPPKDPPAKKK